MAHSSFIINYYLIDENNEYILDENGDKIIISTQSVDIDHDYQAIGGQASSRRRYRTVQSFDVKSTEDQTDWHLIINQQTFVGRYPTQAAAISVLYGIMYQHSGNENSFAFVLEDMINRGGSTIDPVGDNLPFESFSGGEYATGIRNFNTATWITDGVATARVNAVVTDRIQVTSGPIGGTLTNTTTDIFDGVPSQEATTKLEYGYQYNSQVRVTDTVAPDPEFNTYQTSITQFPALSANLSFQSGFPIVGQPLTATATLTNYDSRIPVKYQWTWKQNPSGSNTTVKTETTTSSTSSYTPTSTFNYRVEVEILYALDDSSTGVTDSETSGNAQQPFEWLQGPEILNLAQDQYYVFPLAGTDYEATPTPSFNYEWMKNGSAFGTDSASQILDQEGTYTVDVTGQNTINGVPYSETILSRNAIVISPASVDVADIKLFLTNDPTGTVITNPVGGTVYYAYAYDASDVLLTDSGIEWVAPISGGVVPGTGFTGTTAQPSDVSPSVGETFALDKKPVAHWSELVLRATEEDSAEINVVAAHYNGIERVDFIADGGTPLSVSSTTVKYDTDPNFGSDVYSATLDLSGVSAGTSVEVRAIVYPNAGRPRVLQGDLVVDQAASNDGKEGIKSSFVTKTSQVIQVPWSTSTTLLDALDALDFRSDINAQYELVAVGGNYELGASVTPSIPAVNPMIPIRIAGFGIRATRISRAVYDSGNFMGNFALEFENCNIVTGTFAVGQSGGATDAMNLFKNCTLTGEFEVPSVDYTDGSNTITAAVWGTNDVEYSNRESDSTITLCSLAQRQGFPVEPVFTSGTNIQRGVHIQDCTTDMELGDGVYFQRSTTSVNTVADAAHCAAVIGLRLEGASWGYNQITLLTNDLLVWAPGVVFTAGDRVMVPAGKTLAVPPDNGGSVSRTHSWTCSVTHTSPSVFTADSNWSDSLAPHVDLWQGRPTQAGINIFDNIWLSEISTDDNSVQQPFLYRNAELLENMYWKNWDIVNNATFTSSLVSQLSTHVDHWLMDNCVWPDGPPESVQGEQLIKWEDPSATLYGWGETDPGLPAANQAVGCKNAKWTNSAVRNLSFDAAWDAGGAGKPATFTDFGVAMNSNTGSYVGFDLAIDAYTNANSYLSGNGPVAPFNMAVTAGAGLAEEGDTVSMNATYEGTEPITVTYSWTRDGSEIAGEDAATYPKVGTIPASDVGTVIVGFATASNAYGSASDSHTFGAIAPAGGAEGWETHSDGVWRVVSASNSTDIAGGDGLVVSTTAYSMATTNAARGWYRASNFPTVRYYNTTGGEVPPPAIAVWNETTSAWLGASEVPTFTPSSANTLQYNVNATTGSYWSFAQEGDELFVVYLTQMPTDLSLWAPYDGPLTPPATDLFTTPTWPWRDGNATINPITVDSGSLAGDGGLLWAGRGVTNALFWATSNGSSLFDRFSFTFDNGTDADTAWAEYTAWELYNVTDDVVTCDLTANSTHTPGANTISFVCPDAAQYLENGKSYVFRGSN